MMSVSLRELKNRQTELAGAVPSGETVLVTDRREVVAELVPPGQNSREPGIPSALAALVKNGDVTLGGSKDANLYPKLPRLLKRGKAAELLDAERDAR